MKLASSFYNIEITHIERNKVNIIVILHYELFINGENGMHITKKNCKFVLQKCELTQNVNRNPKAKVDNKINFLYFIVPTS